MPASTAANVGSFSASQKTSARGFGDGASAVFLLLGARSGDMSLNKLEGSSIDGGECTMALARIKSSWQDLNGDLDRCLEWDRKWLGERHRFWAMLVVVKWRVRVWVDRNPGALIWCKSSSLQKPRNTLDVRSATNANSSNLHRNNASSLSLFLSSSICASQRCVRQLNKCASRGCSVRVGAQLWY